MQVLVVTLLAPRMDLAVLSCHFSVAILLLKCAPVGVVLRGVGALNVLVRP